MATKPIGRTKESEVNAEKNRGDSNWFSHEAHNDVSSVSNHTNNNHNKSNKHKNSESVNWMKDSKAEDQKEVTPPKHNHQATVSDWYKHGADVPDPPSLTTKKTSRRSNCDDSKQKQQSNNSNDWFKHQSQPQAPSTQTVHSNNATSSLWFAKDDANGQDMHKTNSRVISVEADDNYKRDKSGSATDWYSHDPQIYNNQEKKSKASTPFSQKSKTNSENWFAPDKSDVCSPSPPSGLASSANRRNQSSNISAIIGDYRS